MLFTTLVVWYSAGLFACLINEIWDYYSGKERTYTINYFAVCLLMSLLGGLLLFLVIVGIIIDTKFCYTVANKIKELWKRPLFTVNKKAGR
jgi:hypothetical protein